MQTTTYVTFKQYLGLEVVQAHSALWIFNSYGIQCLLILMLLLYTMYLSQTYTQTSLSVSPPFLPYLHTHIITITVQSHSNTWSWCPPYPFEKSLMMHGMKEWAHTKMVPSALGSQTSWFAVHQQLLHIGLYKGWYARYWRDGCRAIWSPKIWLHQ